MIGILIGVVIGIMLGPLASYAGILLNRTDKIQSRISREAWRWSVERECARVPDKADAP